MTTDAVEQLGRDELISAYRTLQETVGAMQRNLERKDQQFNEIARLSSRSTAVAEIAREINTIDLADIVRIAVMRVPSLFGARYASVFIYDYETDELVLQRHNHPDAINERVNIRTEPFTIMALAIKNDAPLLLKDIDDFEKRQGIKLARARADKYLTNSCLILPLMAGHEGGNQRIIGVLNLADKGDRSPFSEDDQAVAVQIAELMGAALSTCQLVTEMRTLAETDGLTRLFNHRMFREALDREISRYRRYGSTFSIVMADIDEFKQFNDRHGHLAGDYALRETARMLRKTLRDGIDIAARYGGEEFAVILPETDLAGAAAAAGRLRESIERQRIEYHEALLKVTISLGAAECGPKDTATMLIERADQALYAAKQAGRNLAYIEEFGQVRPVAAGAD
jgi:diguanylate cyclase (GGDEF)-like protein